MLGAVVSVEALPEISNVTTKNMRRTMGKLLEHSVNLDSFIRSDISKSAHSLIRYNGWFRCSCRDSFRIKFGHLFLGGRACNYRRNPR